MKKANENDADISVKMEPLIEDGTEADITIKFQPWTSDNLGTEGKEKQAEDGRYASSSLISAAAAGKLPAHSAGSSARDNCSSVSSAGALKEVLMTSVTSAPKSVDKVAVVGSILSHASLVRGLEELKQDPIGSVSQEKKGVTLHSEDSIPIFDFQTLENGKNQPIALSSKVDGTETPGHEQNSDSTLSISTEQLDQPRKRAKLYSCQHCMYTTSWKHNLTTHLIIHRSNMDKQLSCDQCHYRTYVEEHLRRHLRVHQPGGNKRHSCNLCNYRSDFTKDMRKHALTHTKIPLACELCEYRTHHKTNFLKHTRAHHSNQNDPLACEHCEYRTYVKRTLERHILTHASTRDKPFACSNCSYKTDRRSSLARHRLTHQSNGKKLFS